MTKDEGIIAEKEYIDKYKNIDVNHHITFKEAENLYYEIQKDKIKDFTLKTYKDIIKFMELLSNA